MFPAKRRRLARLDGIVGAITRDVSRLLTPNAVRDEIDEKEPVTNFRLRGLIAVATDVSQTSAVVAFLALTAILCHVAYIHQS